MHKRPKPRTGHLPTAVDDEFELVIICLCEYDHEELVVEVTQTGRPKVVTGNLFCWYGLFCWITAHLADNPDKKLIQLWNTRLKRFGTVNMGTTPSTQKGFTFLF